MHKIKYPITIAFSLSCVLAYLLNNPSIFLMKDNNILGLLLWVFAHTDLNHLISNLVFILLLLPIIEERYDTFIIIASLIFTSLFISIFHILFFQGMLLGASGIVFMLILLTASNGKISIPFIILLVIIIITEFINSFKNNSVSEFSHLVGALLGTCFGIILPKKISNAKNTNIIK